MAKSHGHISRKGPTLFIPTFEDGYRRFPHEGEQGRDVSGQHQEAVPAYAPLVQLGTEWFSVGLFSKWFPPQTTSSFTTGLPGGR